MGSFATLSFASTRGQATPIHTGNTLQTVGVHSALSPGGTVWMAHTALAQRPAGTLSINIA